MTFTGVPVRQSAATAVVLLSAVLVLERVRKPLAQPAAQHPAPHAQLRAWPRDGPALPRGERERAAAALRAGPRAGTAPAPRAHVLPTLVLPHAASLRRERSDVRGATALGQRTSGSMNNCRMSELVRSLRQFCMACVHFCRPSVASAAIRQLFTLAGVRSTAVRQRAQRPDLTQQLGVVVAEALLLLARAPRPRPAAMCFSSQARSFLASSTSWRCSAASARLS